MLHDHHTFLQRQYLSTLPPHARSCVTFRSCSHPPQQLANTELFAYGLIPALGGRLTTSTRTVTDAGCVTKTNKCHDCARCELPFRPSTLRIELGSVEPRNRNVMILVPLLQISPPSTLASTYSGRVPFWLIAARVARRSSLIPNDGSLY
ncbi:hypothetical protein JAAARDRAFT_427287 [Jaapia argillacea MUCL 33604]|uniref:Uncharacterized protein n=1 Tax=Jaapia argillacea MUCL 33604 TaxID=933084 RepID=A0A067PT52_9AGAM|nr:hypothetical protein JAAARDRAFT_427287 [Jaapia argillacea MUCL 33604]